MNEVSGSLCAKGKRIAIVVSRFNEYVTKPLAEGAIDEAQRHGAEVSDLIHVPGTWEIPLAVAALLDRPETTRPHGVVALGCILQGATLHAQLLAQDVGEALSRLQAEKRVPVTWGILTPDTQEQAIERAGMKLGNKGREATLAALEMVSVVEQIEGR